MICRPCCAALHTLRLAWRLTSGTKVTASVRTKWTKWVALPTAQASPHGSCVVPDTHSARLECFQGVGWVLPSVVYLHCISVEIWQSRLSQAMEPQFLFVWAGL